MKKAATNDVGQSSEMLVGAHLDLIASTRRLQRNLKFLYASLILLTCGCLATIALCRYEVHELRKRLEFRDHVTRNGLKSRKSSDSYPINSTPESSDEGLMRIWGDTTKKIAEERRKRKKRDEPEYNAGEDYGGSGATTVTLEDEIWMNTYSRIEVNFFHIY